MGADHDVGEVERALERLRRSCLLVDVRTREEFAAARVPGSLNVPLANLEDGLEVILRSLGGRQLALVCRTGQRAAKAAEFLEGEVATDVHLVDGGLAAWERAGLPLERGAVAGVPFSIERQVRLSSGAVATVGSTLSLLHPGFLALPLAVGAGLVHAGLTDSCALASVLGRMPWNRPPLDR